MIIRVNNFLFNINKKILKGNEIEIKDIINISFKNFKISIKIIKNFIKGFNIFNIKKLLKIPEIIKT